MSFAALRSGLAAGLATALVALAGCASTAAPPVPRTDLVWPEAPETARIRFVKTVSRPADLGISDGLLVSVFRYLIGSADPPLVSPHGIAVDADGRLYVADSFSRVVHVYDEKARRYRVLPKGDSSLVLPIGVAVDERRGRVYVSDSAAGVLRIFSRDGEELGPPIRPGGLQRPTGLAVNPATDELLVVDTLAAAVLRIALPGHELRGIIGGEGEAQGRFHYPTHVATAPDGSILVTDGLNFRIQVFAPDGRFVRAFGAAGDGPGTFSRPKGVAADSDGNVYVADALFDNVQVFDAKGALLMSFGNAGQGDGEFWMPGGVFIDRADRIYVADPYNRRVQVFQYLKIGAPPS